MYIYNIDYHYSNYFQTKINQESFLSFLLNILFYRFFLTIFYYFTLSKVSNICIRLDIL